MLATVDAIEPIREADAVADRTSSMPTRVTTTVTSVWPCASADHPPSSPCVSSANHVQLARTVGLDRRARPLLY